MSGRGSFLPEGSKVTEADVLRQFMRNIHHAAFNCGASGGGARAAYLDAQRRLRALEARQHGRLATPVGKLP